MFRDLKLQPRSSWEAHFGGKTEPSLGLECFDAPEVESITHAQVDGIATSATHPNSAHHQIEQAANSPEPVSAVPTSLATDPLDRCEGDIGRGVDIDYP
jgi:hypothetical protein